MAKRFAVRFAFIVGSILLFSVSPRLFADENHWTGGGGDNLWSNDANWSLGIVPDATQDVFIDLPGTNEVVLDIFAEVGSFSLGGADFNTLTISNANLRCIGAGEVGANAVLNLMGDLSPEQTFTVDGMIDWTSGELGADGGSGTVVISPLGELDIHGSDLKDIRNNLRNEGVIRAGGVQLLGSAETRFTNENLIIIEADLTFIYTSPGDAQLNNSGTILLPADSGTATLEMDWNFDNHGTVRAETNSVLQIVTALFDVMEFDDGTVFEGDGIIRFPDIGVADFTWDGLLTLNGTLEFAASTFFGSPVWQGTGTFHWLGGTMANFTFSPNFYVELAGDDSKEMLGECTNSGVMRWLGDGGVFGDDTTFFVNRNLITAETDCVLANFGPLPNFDNAGTILRPADSGTASFQIGWNFINHGTISAETNSVLEIQPTIYDGLELADGTLLEGDGVIRFPSSGLGFSADGMATVNGTVEFAGNLYLGGSTWEGSGNFLWQGGTLANLTFAPNFNVQIVGDDAKVILGACTNLGIIRWQGAGSVFGDDETVFVNLNLITAEGDCVLDNFGYIPMFDNRGTILRPAGSGDASLQIGWNFVNHGTISAGTNSVLEIQPTLYDAVEFADGTLFDGDGVIRFPSSGFEFSADGIMTLNGTIDFHGDLWPGGATWQGSGNFFWEGGTLAGFTFAPNFNVQIIGEDDKVLSGNCTNSGIIRWRSDGGIFGDDESVFENMNLFTVESNCVMGEFGAWPTFENSGTILCPADSGTASLMVGWSFINHGSFIVETNSVLEISPTLYDTLHFVDGTIFGGDGIVRFPATFISFRWDGSITLNGTLEYAGNGYLGEPVWTGSGTFVWLGGFIGSFTFGPGFQVQMVGDDVKQLSGSCTNLGVIRWIGEGAFIADDSSFFLNANLMMLETNCVLGGSLGLTGSFDNSGTLLRPADRGTGSLTIEWHLVNHGTVSVAANSMLDIEPEVFDSLSFAPGTLFDGAGIIHFPAGALPFSWDGAMTLNGTIQYEGLGNVGAPIWSGTGLFRWLGGEMNNFTFGPNFHVDMGGTSTKFFSGAGTNQGIVRWIADTDMQTGGQAAFNNEGLFLVEANGAWSPSIAFHNETTGIVRQSGGVFSLGGLSNAGTLDLDSGELAATNATSASTAIHLLALGGPAMRTGYGLLNAQNLNLDGQLAVVLTNGFVPTNGSSFTIATDIAESGQYATTALPVLPSDLAWRVRYLPGSVTLSVQAFALSEPGMLPDGSFQFTVVGPAGNGYDVQVSTNLQNWVTIETNYPFAGQITFTDTNAMRFEHRFYRARIFR